MRIMNVKKAIIFLLAIGLMVVVTGCARWPDGPNGNGGTENYQLEITVEVAGEINTFDGIYYIGLDTDGQTGFGPGSDIGDWEGYYYVKLDSIGCYLYPKEEGSPISLNYSTSDNGSKLQVTIALSYLGDPEGSIDINVVTTDSDGYTTYDYLDDYFNIGTVLYSKGEGSSSTDLEEDKAGFDIVKATAVITTLY